MGLIGKLSFRREIMLDINTQTRPVPTAGVAPPIRGVKLDPAVDFGSALQRAFFQTSDDRKLFLGYINARFGAIIAPKNINLVGET